MTLAEIKMSDKIWLTAKDIAKIMKCDPGYIRYTAHVNPKKLGYEVDVVGSRVRINRKKFLHYLGEDD